jgi:hypothetical protein
MVRASIHLLWILLLCGAASASAQTPHRMKPQKASAKPSPVQPQAAVAPQQVPPPHLTPEHGPASPPDVSFQQGQLTIVARNSTMSDVLNAVKQKTGASVDMPAGSSERVVGQFGPGAPRDVMAQLLNGSHYDYVLLGSPADPGALNKIMLMAKASGPEPGPSPHANQPQGGNENLPAVPDVESENPEPNSGEATPNMQEPPQEEAQPDQSPDESQEQQNGPVVKTPEQLLRELQQQQQQQQQQNQGGPPGAPGQPPQ